MSLDVLDSVHVLRLFLIFVEDILQSQDQAGGHTRHERTQCKTKFKDVKKKKGRVVTLENTEMH